MADYVIVGFACKFVVHLLHRIKTPQTGWSRYLQERGLPVNGPQQYFAYGLVIGIYESCPCTLFVMFLVSFNFKVIENIIGLFSRRQVPLAITSARRKFLFTSPQPAASSSLHHLSALQVPFYITSARDKLF